jgi:ATP-dependent DNA helicase
MTQANQLDFLLNKASQYSNFITKDLEDLQSAITDNARRKLDKAEKRAKKRKASDGKESSKKKSKKGSGDALKSALASRAGAKPIFVQPPNLAKDCFLKDYQLEGVRWLASLFENGVSGILADEVSGKLHSSSTNACAFVGC